MDPFCKIANLELQDKIKERLIGLCSGDRVLDILFHKPRDFINRHNFKTIRQAKDQENVSIKATFQSINHSFLGRVKRKKVFKFICFDLNSDLLEIIFFSKIYCKLTAGQKYVVCGKITNQNQMVHPDKILHQRELEKLLPQEPVYPCTDGVKSGLIISLNKGFIDKLDKKSEWINKNLLLQKKWPSWFGAVANLHFPKNLKDFYLARERLAFDEMIAMHSVIKKTQETVFALPKKPVNSKGDLFNDLVQKLGFKLTGCQKLAIEKIKNMQASKSKMTTLLQGDVGSGKTVVIFAAMLNAAECGMQSALLAPTSILAKQHAAKLKQLMPELKIELLLGGTAPKKKEKLLQKIKDGDIKIIIGTHALLSHGVEFCNLALLAIDEQHRFGADQRTKILKENTNADLLLVSATPIPRTIAQTLFGSVTYLNLKQKPSHRIKTETATLRQSKIKDLVSRLESMIKNDSKVFWICPLVEENEDLDRASVTERYKFLKQYFKEEIDFIHGALKEPVINKKIDLFRAGKIKVILSTTVVEVGVDVPDADIIVIESAESFGLAQLHQLRGRVGRGGKKSFCILLYQDDKLTETAEKRLKILKNSDDGFLIAEEDFKMRGSGEIFGQKQSGFSKFKFISERKDIELFPLAAKCADDMLKNGNNQDVDLLIKMFFPSNNYYL